MGKSIQCALTLLLMSILSTAVHADSFMRCERGHDKERIQSCTTIIDDQALTNQPLSDDILAIVYYNRADAFMRRGNDSRAIDDFDQAINLNPAIALAYFQRGNVFRNQGNFKRAIGDYDKTIELNPKYAAAYFNRADANFSLGNIQQAVDDYDVAFRLDRSLVDTWIGLRRIGMRP